MRLARLIRTLHAATAPGLACLLVLAIGFAGFAQPTPAATGSSDAASVDSVINLITHRHPEVRSYEAHTNVQIQQVNFPWLHSSLDGEVYYHAPGFTVYKFHHTPSYLEGITKVEGAMGMASRWGRCYDITLENQPESYILHMTPKIRGEVTRLDVTVNKQSGDLQHFNWSYQELSDGISLTQYYTNVHGYSVVTLQQSEITRHHIRAKATGTFDSFVYNVPVPTPTPTPSDPLHQCDN